MTPRRRVQLRYARMRFWRKQSEQFTRAGLNTRGTQRRYRLRPEISLIHGRARKRAYQRLRRREMMERGLTTRGTPNRHAPSPLERAWRELRATMDVPQTDFLTLGERNHDRE